MSRYYVRCVDCLGLSVVDLKERAAWGKCACGGALESMGRIRGDTWGNTATRCACDARCTCASGPNCDCSCGGANHGSGLVVEYWIEGGRVNLRRVGRIDDSAAAEWRAAYPVVQRAFECWRQRRPAYLSATDYKTAYYVGAMIGQARAARVHRVRMEKLRLAAERLGVDLPCRVAGNVENQQMALAL